MTDVVRSTRSEHRSEQKKPRRVKGMIYVLINPSFPAVKFGHSTAGSGRPRAQMAPGIVFHCAIDGSESQERKVQAHFHRFRIPPEECGGQREWFHLTGEVAEYVDFLGQQVFAATSLEEMDQPDGVSNHPRRFPWQKWREVERNGDGAQQQLTLPRMLTPKVRAARPVSDRQEAHLRSDSDDWYTPLRFIDAVHEVMGGIDLDPASCRSANFNVRAESIYTRDDDGLTQLWEADRVYLNPPYGEEARNFTYYLLKEIRAGRVREAIVCLNANSVTSHWFEPLWDHTLCFVRGRVDFIDGMQREAGSSSTHGTVFVYLGDNADLFDKVFSRFGAVARRCRSAA